MSRRIAERLPGQESAGDVIMRKLGEKDAENAKLKACLLSLASMASTMLIGQHGGAEKAISEKIAAARRLAGDA